MQDEKELLERDIEAYLERHQNKELLRLVAVGSVDDGKSTLIGRLLHDTHGVYEDQLSAVKRASTQNNLEIDFSLFTDGLKAEREQGITIDVAYRYFSTDKRKFIIADTPGHVQYTRNMATGASTANVGIILIDARLGVLQQSRRHAFIASLLGIPHLAVAVNKMDLSGYDRAIFDSIRAEFSRFAERLGFKDVKFVPISALCGDNVVHSSENMPWYEGGTFLEYLETVPIASDRNHRDFRFPVQYVVRPHLDYRGFAAEIASGVVKKDDRVMVLPSRKESRIRSIDTFEGELPSAFAPMSVTLRLADEIDVSRGDMIVHPDNLPHVGQRFDAMMVWLSERPLDPEKSYLLKHTTQVVRADVESVRYVVNLDTLEHVPSPGLTLNDIGNVRVRCHRPIYFDAYGKNRSTGAFVLVDSITNNTVAAGMIVEPEREALLDDSAAGRRRSQVSVRERRSRLGQSGIAVWITGAAGAASAGVAYALERRLFDLGRVAAVVDLTDGPSAESAEGAAAPLDTIRRMVAAGLVVVVSSPELFDRARVRGLLGEGQLAEVRLLPEAAAPSESPDAPFAGLSLVGTSVESAADRIARALEERGTFEAG